MQRPQISTSSSNQSNIPQSSPTLNGNLAKRQRINSVPSGATTSTYASSSNLSNTFSTPVTQLSIESSVTFAQQSHTPSSKISPNQVKSKPSPAASTKKSPSNSRSPSVFEWPSYIEETKSNAAPVFFFNHVPLSSFWRKIISNVIIEVPHQPLGLNKDLKSNVSDDACYWFAWVIQYAGYMAKVRYFGYENDPSHDFWIHMCDSNVHHVGWAAESGHLIVPLAGVVDQHQDDHEWKNHLLNKLIGCKTLPVNFHKQVN